MNTAWNRWCRNLPSGIALSLYDNCITPIIITDITGKCNVRIQNPFTCTTSSAAYTSLHVANCRRATPTNCMSRVGSKVNKTSVRGIHCEYVHLVNYYCFSAFKKIGPFSFLYYTSPVLVAHSPWSWILSLKCGHDIASFPGLPRFLFFGLRSV